MNITFPPFLANIISRRVCNKFKILVEENSYQDFIIAGTNSFKFNFFKELILTELEEVPGGNVYKKVVNKMTDKSLKETFQYDEINAAVYALILDNCVA